MQRLFRPLSALFLALVLALASHSMAAARGLSGPATEIILCTGTGPVAIWVDDTGAPTGAPHICPDCALSLFDMAAPQAVIVISRAWQVVKITPVFSEGWPAQDCPRPVARGPPDRA